MKYLKFIFSLFVSTLFSQAPTIEWQRTFGGSDEDYGYAVTTDADENIIVGGSTLSTDGDITQSYGDLDIWVIKYDTHGNLIWKKNYGGSGNDYIWDIRPTNDGGYIFAGHSDSTDGDVSQNFGASDFWVVKLDTQGNIQWEKSYGGSDFEDVSKIIETGSGHFILIGSSFSNDGAFTNNQGNSDIALAKIDNNGNLLWSQLFGGSGYDVGIDGIIDSFGNIVISAYGNSNDDIFIGSSGGSDVLLMSLTEDGFIIWTTLIGGSGNDQTYSLIQLNNGNYLVGINSNSNDGAFENNFGNSDVWLFEINPGIFINKFHFGGSFSEAPMALYETTTGDIIVGCRSASSDGDVSNNHGASDFWIFKMNPSGNIIWENSYGGSGIDGLWDMVVTNDGIVLVGDTTSNDGDVSGNHGLDDMWILKLNREDMGLVENNLSTINIYPNPSSDKVYIETDEIVISLELYDLNGKLILKKSNTNNSLKELDLTKLIKGTYILKIKTNTQLITEKIIKK